MVAFVVHWSVSGYLVDATEVTAEMVWMMNDGWMDGWITKHACRLQDSANYKYSGVMNMVKPSYD